MNSTFAIVLGLTTGAWFACASDPGQDDPSCAGDQCDSGSVLEATAIAECRSDEDFKTSDGRLKCTPCGKTLADASGRGFLPAFIGDDALMENVYMAFTDADKNGKIDPAEIDCPIEMAQIMAKLDKFDNKQCRGIETRVVSETAAPLGRNGADYRAVTSRDCNGRGKHGLLFSTFGYSGADGAKGSGLHITENAAPGEVEIIAFDKSEGVFNYYKEVGERMRFFGSSIDFVVAGAGGPELTSTRGCANCHPGGGLNMKELQSPWTHWSLQDNIDGSDVLVSSRQSFMGRLQSGSDMEFQVTEAGNTAWNATKLAFFRALTADQLAAARGRLKDDKLSPAQRADLDSRQLKTKLNPTQMLLQPLFCAVQVNINAPTSTAVPSQLTGANLRGLSPFAGVNFSDAEYRTALDAIGSKVEGTGKSDLTNPFMIVERSHEDNDYVTQLRKAGVIDNKFEQAVAMVDITRAVLSDDRCGLLRFVPDLAPADRNAAKITEAIIAKLAAANAAQGTPEGQLLAHLRANPPVNVFAITNPFTTACEKRPKAEILRDGLKLRSLQRKQVYRFDEDGSGLDRSSGSDQHPFAVFEFEATMPADEIAVRPGADPADPKAVDPNARFSPVDCTLVSKFVPVGPN